MIGGSGNEAHAMGKLPEFADAQFFGGAYMQIGRQSRSVIGDRLEIIVIGVIADLDIGMVDHLIEIDGVGVDLPVGQRKRVTLRGVQQGTGHLSAIL